MSRPPRTTSGWARLRSTWAGLRGNELFRGRYYVCATAGTTGRRGVFVLELRRVGRRDRLLQPGIPLGGVHRRVDPSGQDRGGQLDQPLPPVSAGGCVDPQPLGADAAPGFLRRRTWRAFVARLNEWQPQMLIGYASPLRLLAEEQFAGRLAIAPEFVFSASEVLTDSTRTLATIAWGQSPHNVYGATEASGRGRAVRAAPGDAPCSRTWWSPRSSTRTTSRCHRVCTGRRCCPLCAVLAHPAADPLRDDRQRPARRRARPGPCGRPYALLDGIQGRAQEALHFPTGDGGGRVVQPIVFHHVMDRVTAAAWQIIQRPDGLEVLLVQPHEVGQPVLVAAACRPR